MYQSIPTIGVIAGITAIQALAYDVNALSPEAQAVRKQAGCVLENFEQSQALFGAKSNALAQLMAVVAEEQTVDVISVLVAKKFIRALPDAVPTPECSIDPDGAVSLDWIYSRNKIFSVSIGGNSRLAYAWLDGTDKGHAVARFDGRTIPERILDGIISITTENASIRLA